MTDFRALNKKLREMGLGRSEEDTLRIIREALDLPQPPKEPQPSQGAGAEEMAEAWIAEQREKRSRWDAMENCYRVDIGIVETWLAGHASGYSKGRASQDARIGELERERDSLLVQLENKSKEIGRSEHRGNTVDYIYDKLENYSRQLGECAKERDSLRCSLALATGALEKAKKKIDGQICVPWVTTDCEGNQVPMEPAEVRLIGHRISVEIQAALAAMGKVGGPQEG